MSDVSAIYWGDKIIDKKDYKIHKNFDLRLLFTGLFLGGVFGYMFENVLLGIGIFFLFVVFSYLWAS